MLSARVREREKESVSLLADNKNTRVVVGLETIDAIAVSVTLSGHLFGLFGRCTRSNQVLMYVCVVYAESFCSREYVHTVYFFYYLFLCIFTLRLYI
jgi:hypothetical protein